MEKQGLGKVTICCTQSPVMVVEVCGVLWGILGPGVWVFEINSVRSIKFVASMKTRRTLGPAYYEFGYYEHPAIMSRFFSLK